MTRYRAARAWLVGLAWALGLLAPLAAQPSAADVERFHTAIVRDHVSPMLGALLAGVDINTPGPGQQPPLVLALQRESWQVARLLAELPDLDVEARNPSGETALMLAAIRGQTDVVQTLLRRGAQVNQAGWTALHYAATHDGAAAVDITRLLLAQQPQVNALSPNGTTPLMMAAQYGGREVVALLLQQGADPMLRNQQGLSAADFAMRAQRADVVELLAAAMRARQPRGTW